VHLWLGLSVGCVFALLGLTGAILVFYVEIDQGLNPELAPTQPLTAPSSYQAVLDALHRAHPDRHGAWRIEAPLEPGRPIMVRYYRPAETAGLAFSPLMVSIDPATLTVGASRFWGDFAMTWIYDLHYSLLLDRTGRTVVAVVGLCLLVSFGSGVFLWWPSAARLRGALTMKRNASGARRIYDLHTLSGVYGVIVFAMLALTGAMLDEPTWFNPVIHQMSPLRPPDTHFSTPLADRDPITVDAAIAAAMKRFPDAELRWIETPADISGVFRINLYQPGEPGRRFPKTNVWVDQFSGSVVASRDALQDAAGDTVLAWLHPLHSGEAFGMTGRIIVLVSGLLPPVLLVTGFLRWRQKRRVRMQKSARLERSSGDSLGGIVRR